MAIHKVENSSTSRVAQSKLSNTDGIKSDLATGVSKKNQNSKVTGANEAVTAQISNAGLETAQSIQKAFDIAKSTPDIREDKVADLRRRIQSGEYKTDSDGILLGMLNEASKDDLALELQKQEGTNF